MKPESKASNGEKKILSLYLNEANRFKILTREEEKLASKEELVKHNLRFAMQVARKYMGTGKEIEDLIGEANAGLIEASKRWDPSRDIRFISFAVDWMKQSITTSLNRHVRIVRLPANQLKDMRKVEGKIIAENKLSFSESSNSDSSDERTVEDTLGNEAEANLDHDTMHTKYLISKALGKLKPLHQDIIKMRYSIDSEYEMSSEEIADKLGYTKTRINQILRESLTNLKEELSPIEF
jgi:RNA polymerase primary sigma factor